MKPKYIRLLFIVIGLLLGSCIVDIELHKPTDAIDFPDKQFLNALIEAGVDTNGDGYVTIWEAEAVTKLELIGVDDGSCDRIIFFPCDPGYDDDITDITGIEMFINLDTLILKRKLFEEIDLSNCNKLSYLKIDARLTNLDIAQNTALAYLDCSNNQLENLDLSLNTELIYLDCSLNQLSRLDIADNPKLKTLRCMRNQLTNLDLSNILDLTMLDCSNNYLSNLNLSTNTSLVRLYCRSNQLTNLDVSKNLILETFWCDLNQLSELDISKNILLRSIGLSGMHTLTKVCVWELPFPPTGVTLYTNGTPHVYYSTDCN